MKHWMFDNLQKISWKFTLAKIDEFEISQGFNYWKIGEMKSLYVLNI
jgi:hypothetical protein